MRIYLFYFLFGFLFCLQGCMYRVYSYERSYGRQEGYILHSNRKNIYYELGQHYSKSFYPSIDYDDNIDSVVKKCSYGWDNIEEKFRSINKENSLIYCFENNCDTFYYDTSLVTKDIKLPLRWMIIKRFESSGASYLNENDLFSVKYLKDSVFLFNNRKPELIKMFSFSKNENDESEILSRPLIFGFSSEAGIPLYIRFAMQEFNLSYIEKIEAVDYSKKKLKRKKLINILN